MNPIVRTTGRLLDLHMVLCNHVDDLKDRIASALASVREATQKVSVYYALNRLHALAVNLSEDFAHWQARNAEKARENLEAALAMAREEFYILEQEMLADIHAAADHAQYKWEHAFDVSDAAADERAFSYL